ncbi:heterokaryon incompatibility protein-domain-containing protein [Aspergillus carlsbadensis]|nr:heterokaryon incompatibility protein-domain-containing protein [Aspergillus carlsbadensis]
MASPPQAGPACDCTDRCMLCNHFHEPCKYHEKETDRVSYGRRKSFDWSELLHSARTCSCCDMLLQGCREFLKQHDLKEADIDHGALSFSPEGQADNDILVLTPVYVPVTPQRLKTINIGFSSGLWAELDVFVSAHETGFSSKLQVLKRTSPRSDSDQALATIRGWLEECIHSHGAGPYFCDSIRTPQLPTRVVDVGTKDGIIKLVEPQGARGTYACLSHCWGRSQIITTTRENIRKHKENIAWDSLSQTFKDAITLVRKLGLQYIWIDSLCIVQDDTKDWEIESSRMASIYRNGHFTLAATRSRSGNGGMFRPTPDVEVRGRAPSGESLCLYFREVIEHHTELFKGKFSADENRRNDYDDDGDDVKDDFSKRHTSMRRNFPLLSRAWVFQERMLSTRVIHFGRHELFFECQSGMRCECGLIIPQARYMAKAELASILECISCGDHTQVKLGSLPPHYTCAVLWRTMAACYASLWLTKSKDRLPALGGLARHMSTHRKSRYLAGCWEDSLNDDLVWTVAALDPAPRPYPLNAPTWSWASVEADTVFWDLFLSREKLIKDPRVPYEHFSTVERCEVQPSAVDEFGTLSHGSLTISGLVMEGILEFDSPDPVVFDIYGYHIAFPHTREMIDPDYDLAHPGPGETKPGTPLLCLRMSSIHRGYGQNLISLVLRESTTQPGCFERIGTMVVEDEDIHHVDPFGGVFEHASTRTVTIV